MIITDSRGYEYMKWKRGSTFPVSSGISDIMRFCNNAFECHWHDGVELLYVIDGELEHSVNGVRHIMREGDFMFVNSGSMHEGCATEARRGRYMVISFLPSFLCAESKGRIAEKYFGSVMDSENFPLLYLPRENKKTARIIEVGNEVARLMRDRTPCYELNVKADLFKIWALLFEEASKNEGEHRSDIAIDRMKQTVEYIGANYQNKITLEEIAAECNVSKRELCRSFKRVMHRTLFEYIMDLRIRKSIELLEEGRSVTEAALSSGFFDSSYYTRTFKKYLDCTPREYVKRMTR